MAAFVRTALFAAKPKSCEVEAYRAGLNPESTGEWGVCARVAAGVAGGMAGGVIGVAGVAGVAGAAGVVGALGDLDRRGVGGCLGEDVLGR